MPYAASTKPKRESPDDNVNCPKCNHIAKVHRGIHEGCKEVINHQPVRDKEGWLRHVPSTYCGCYLSYNEAVLNAKDRNGPVA